MADYLPHPLSDESCAGLLCRLWTHNAQAGPGEDSLLGGCAYSAAIYWIAPLPLFGQELQKEEDLQQKGGSGLQCAREGEQQRVETL